MARRFINGMLLIDDVSSGVPGTPYIMPAQGSASISDTTGSTKYVNVPFNINPTTSPTIIQTAYQTYGDITLALRDSSASGDGAIIRVVWSNDRNSYLGTVIEDMDYAGVTVSFNLSTGAVTVAGGSSVNDTWVMFGVIGGNSRESITLLP